MKDWRKSLVHSDKSIRSAIKIIDEVAAQIALVVNQENRLLGTVTDGDIRRAILHGKSLDDNVGSIMNSSPTTISPDLTDKEVSNIMANKTIHQIPMVDSQGVLVGLKLLDELLREKKIDNPVILMAGGLGNRLRPLTETSPKPLLKVGNKPLLETILMNFIEHGFSKFYFSVNYMASKVVDYFGDGSRWGVKIDYIRENQRMGTAGALSLVPERPEKPVFVMNADLLTKINFSQLLEFHNSHNCQVTLCVREYDFQVPYGVVEIDGHNLLKISEKPVHKFFINAGIYLLNPEVFDVIDGNSFLDMPDLLKKLKQEGKNVAVFPIREYWLDIGHISDLEKAHGDYQNLFE